MMVWRLTCQGDVGWIFCRSPGLAVLTYLDVLGRADGLVLAFLVFIYGTTSLGEGCQSLKEVAYVWDLRNISRMKLSGVEDITGSEVFGRMGVEGLTERANQSSSRLAI